MTTRKTRTQDPLDKAFTRLGHMLPPKPARALKWLHSPQSRWVRLPLGVLCIIAGFFWFLPVVGLEFLPIGLLLIAQDVPFMRRPVGLATLKLLDGVDRIMKWWKTRKSRPHRAHR